MAIIELLWLIWDLYLPKASSVTFKAREVLRAHKTRGHGRERVVFSPTLLLSKDRAGHSDASYACVSHSNSGASVSSESNRRESRDIAMKSNSAERRRGDKLKENRYTHTHTQFVTKLL